MAEKLFNSLSDVRALKDLPPEIRRLVVNYPASLGTLDDLELPVGGLSDVIELSNGDQLRGDLMMSAWDLETQFGKVSVPADQMFGMAVAAGLRPRHLLVSSDGEIIGGRLLSPAIKIRISSGQEVSIPSEQVQRIGRRSALADSRAPGRAKPLAYLRTGDRLAIAPPKEPLRIATRFGSLALATETIAALDLQPEQSPVHMVSLTDGSRFSGVLLADELTVTLARGGEVKLPVPLLRKLTFAAESSDDTEPAARLMLSGGDVLTISLPQRLTLLTSYGEVSVNGGEVKTISRVKDSQEEIQVTLWDNSVITGRLPQPYLECSLAGNAMARVAVGGIEQYTCTAPRPSAGIVDKVKALVAELNADDWKQRERAEAELVSVGTGIIATLKQLRSDQPPEAQQRIDSILKQLEKAPARTNSVSPSPMFVR